MYPQIFTKEKTVRWTGECIGPNLGPPFSLLNNDTQCRVFLIGPLSGLFAGLMAQRFVDLILSYVVSPRQIRLCIIEAGKIEIGMEFSRLGAPKSLQKDHENIGLIQHLLSPFASCDLKDFKKSRSIDFIPQIYRRPTPGVPILFVIKRQNHAD